MVIGYFSTFSTYGFWLPNDQRGSGSVYVGSPALYRFGPATKVDTRHSVARAPYDPVIRREARASLKYPHVELNDEQILAVGRGFADVVARTGCVIYACAILPDHSHVVTDRPRYEIEKLIILLKGGATARLRAEGLHPFQDYADPGGKLPKMWGRGDWNVFLDDEPMVVSKIQYTEDNPLRQKPPRPRQRWSFVTPYPGRESF
jgi:REP element-mobilizing transposase RayT